MKRMYKNIIASSLVAASMASIGGTMYYIYNTQNKTSNMSFKKGQKPPGMPGGSQNADSSDQMNNSSSTSTTQSLSSDSTSSSNNSNNNTGKMGTPPSRMSKGKSTSASLSGLYYVAFGVESFVLIGSVAYLIISKGSSRKVMIAMNSKKKLLLQE